MNKFARQSFIDIANVQVPFIKAHFEKRGIIISSFSRFGSQCHCVEELAQCQEKGNYNSFIKSYGMDKILSALKEIDELHGITSIYDDDFSEIYISKLGQIIKGSNVPDSREKDTHGRNTIFELNMGAHFIKAGFSVKLAEPDIRITNGNQLIHIACKRPSSLNNFEKIVRSARRQICRLGNGLIALSLDKIMNPSFNVLQGKDTDLISKRIIQEMSSFIDLHREQIAAWANNRKVFGVIYSFGLVGKDLAENLFVTYQQIIVNNLCPPSSPHYLFMLKMEKAFKPISF